MQKSIPRGGPHAGANSSSTSPDTGCSHAPSPAASQTANRTHFFPVASNGIRSVFVPNAVVSVRLTIFRSTFVPSLHTTSAKSSGKVYSIRRRIHALRARAFNRPVVEQNLACTSRRSSRCEIASTTGAQLSFHSRHLVHLHVVDRQRTDTYRHPAASCRCHPRPA